MNTCVAWALLLLGFPLPLAEGFPELARLEFEDLGLPGVSPDLIVLSQTEPAARCLQIRLRPISQTCDLQAGRLPGMIKRVYR